MSYLVKLQNDMKQAMKDKNTRKRDIIRLVITDLNNEKIKLGTELTRDQEEMVLNRYIKKLEKEIEAYIEAGKTTENQEFEKELVLSYLPEKLTEDQIVAIIEQTIVEVGATSAKEMGKVMAALKPKFGNNADMGFVSKTVKQKLN